MAGINRYRVKKKGSVLFLCIYSLLKQKAAYGTPSKEEVPPFRDSPPAQGVSDCFPPLWRSITGIPVLSGVRVGDGKSGFLQTWPPACGAAMAVGGESTCQQAESFDWCLFSLLERSQCSTAWAASSSCISFPLEKSQECSFGPRCRGEGTTCTPARKGNPTQLLPLRRDSELGQTFYMWVIKIRLLHPYVCSHFENTAWLTFLSCLLCTPIMGECFHLSCGFDSGPCTHWKYIYLFCL